MLIGEDGCRKVYKNCVGWVGGSDQYTSPNLGNIERPEGGTKGARSTGKGQFIKGKGKSLVRRSWFVLIRHVNQGSQKEAFDC